MALTLFSGRGQALSPIASINDNRLFRRLERETAANPQGTWVLTSDYQAAIAKAFKPNPVPPFLRYAPPAILRGMARTPAVASCFNSISSST